MIKIGGIMLHDFKLNLTLEKSYVSSPHLGHKKSLRIRTKYQIVFVSSIIFRDEYKIQICLINDQSRTLQDK